MSDKKDLVGFKVHTMEYQTKITTKYANRTAWKAPDENEIRSHIPGTILDFNVKVGDKVKEGVSILVLEAMKMRNQIVMPFDGKIKEICVKVGDRLPKGSLMIIVEK